MHAELKDYIKIEKSFLDAETCKSVIASLKDVNWNEHQFYEASTNEYNNKSGNQELDVSFDSTVYTKIIMDKLWNSIKQYQDDLNYKWFSSWSGYSQIRFNRYTNNKKMAMHCDHITDLFDGQNKGIPTLSLLGILNDDYQGGEFIMFDNLQLDLQAGDLLIFPSNFMYPHRVEPVTNGERYSFISWMW
jgi:predicted 2-oxoglutarate/Fe(II)-dependent dioxygenase YbiX